MADFCKQCSEEMFDRDFKELAITNKNVERIYTICEGCGCTVVDRDGVCIGTCLLKHGDIPVQTMQEFLDGVLPGNKS